MRGLQPFISIFIMAFFFIACGERSHDDYEKEKIYAQIDSEIDKVPEYDAIKHQRIQNLTLLLKKETNQELKWEITQRLIDEYESFISDSAIYYINLNLENPTVKADPNRKNSLLIKKADVAAHAGLFGEASDILASLKKETLDSTLLESYYGAYCDLYQYQSEYATESEYAMRHAALRELYIDSISRIAPSTSSNYIINHAASAARNGNFEEAQDLLLQSLERYEPGDRTYSILASILADVYKSQKDEANYLKYISLSVISDLRGAIKENMAIRALATECYNDGDLERAEKYLRQSFADANFYSARMRNAQSSRMLPIIGEAFTSQQKHLNHQLRLFVVFISVLAFGFIIISIFAFVQVKKVRTVNKRTKEMLEEVSQLSSRLSEVNKELTSANKELESINAIKGEYAALFMEYSSLAISSLQRYQQTLRVAAAQGNLQTLIKKIESPNIETKTLSEFYSKFDEAILNIYPNFVDKFNSLLKQDERIELKPKETLNTELRLFALILIGITDPEKIATFLRCSLSTVYTYRSKMKKKSINPERFEEDLLSI